MGQLFQQPESEMVTKAIDKLHTSHLWQVRHRDETMTKEAKENPHQSLDLHHSRGHHLLHHTLLLLENVPQLRICSDSVSNSLSTSGSTHHFQHDGRPNQKMKTLKTLKTLKTFYFYFVKLAIRFSLLHFPLSNPPNNGRYIYLFVFSIVILSNKLDLNQVTRYTRKGI